MLDAPQLSLLEWVDNEEAVVDLDCLDALDSDWGAVRKIEPTVSPLCWLGVCRGRATFKFESLWVDGVSGLLTFNLDIGGKSTVWAEFLEECETTTDGESLKVVEGTTAGDEETPIIGCGSAVTAFEGWPLPEAWTMDCSAAIALVADFVDAYHFDGFFPAFLRVSDLESS